MAYFHIRPALLVLAGVLTIGSLWLVVPELIRPHNCVTVDGSQEHRRHCGPDSWHRAAALAFLRSDYWIRSVSTDSPTAPGDPAISVRTLSATTGRTQAAIERAIAVDPSNAEAWTILADHISQSGTDFRRAIAVLRMSYLTGPNEHGLARLRLAVAARLDIALNDELASFMQRDLRTILREKRDPVPALVTAYRSATAGGKEFISSVLRDFDPAVLARLIAAASR